jgi:Phage tail lysozyme
MADTDTDIPTMTIRPASKQAGQGGADPKAKGWDGGKLSYGDMVKRWKDRGYSDAGARGMADNMTRESSGDPTAIGPGGHAIGLFQHEGPRRQALEAFAKQRGTKPTDPDTQFDFADTELKRDYPTLRAKLQNTNDRAEAEDSFKRVFERPKSVLWGERPKIATDQFRFSPYAIREHADRPNTDIVLMAPDDYLDLSPVLGGKPFDSPSGRSLLASADRGDAMEAIPTLDVDVKGKTGTVTDQDGRQRALLAKHAGVDAIPVAIKKTGDGEPTELTGAQGKVVPNAFPKVAPLRSEATAEKPKKRSLLQRMGDAIIPRAEAAPKTGGAETANPYAGIAELDEDPKPQAAANPYAGIAEPDVDQQTDQQAPPPDQPKAEPDGMLMSALKGAGYGFGKTMLSGEELAGKGLQAIGVSSVGGWMVDDARRGLKKIGDEIAPDQEAHPYATGAGELLGSAPVPLGAAGLGGKILSKTIGTIGGNALKAAGAGAVAGALQPGDTEDYWKDKALKSGIGAVLGTGGNYVAGKAAELIAPKMRPIYEFVERVSGKPASETPGAMAVIKRMETDARSGGPTAQQILDLANATPGKALTLADLGGPEVMALAGRVARARGGDGRSKITNFLNTRDREAGERLAQDVNRDIQRGSAYDQGKALDGARKEAAKPAYEKAYAQPPINPDEMAENGRVGELMNTPSFRSGMRNAMKISAEERVPLTTLGIDLDAQGVPFFTKVPTWRTLDYVKRGMDDVVEDFRDSTTGRLKLNDYGRAANATRADFRNTLRDLNKAYGAALDAYSGPSTSLDALHAGQDFLERSPEEIADRINGFGAGDKEFYKVGAADTLRTRLEKKGVTADEAKAIINNPYMARQLRPLFDSDAAYDRFMASVMAEGRMFASRYEILGGSQTAARRAEDTSPEIEALVHTARTGLHLKSGNLPAAGRAYLAARNALNGMVTPRDNSNIADILTHPIASGTTAQRMADFKQFMAALPTTRAHMARNQLANAARAASPGVTAGAAQLPSVIAGAGNNQQGAGQ